MKKENGFALVIALVVTALLIAVTVEFIHDVYVETSLGKSYEDAQQASLMADSGVHGGMKVLGTILSAQEYSSLQDRWAVPLEIEDERGVLRVEIVDETGKLNLNSIVFPNGTLNETFFAMARRLFRNLKLPADLCDSAVDWIDENNDPRPGGAETSYYGSLPTPYQAKNAPLETFDELRLVKEYGEKTLHTLSPFVMVYNDGSGIPSSRINVNTAPREILAVLDEEMNDDLAGRIVEYRRTTPIRNPADISRIPGLETIGIGLQGRIGVKGNIYRIFSRATVNETIRIVEALVKIDGLQPTVLYWREM